MKWVPMLIDWDIRTKKEVKYHERLRHQCPIDEAHLHRYKALEADQIDLQIVQQEMAQEFYALEDEHFWLAKDYERQYIRLYGSLHTHTWNQLPHRILPRGWCRFPFDPCECCLCFQEMEKAHIQTIRTTNALRRELVSFKLEHEQLKEDYARLDKYAQLRNHDL
ncbi:hypothetical protein NHQ30_003965 [Ciborinia camelliae]|nr:hypothetical protein NHQ30_003965 [Ciborinia camelliae]